MTHHDILERLERCFDEGEIETLTWRQPTSGPEVARSETAIRVVHRPTGLVATAEQHVSQVANKAAALIELLDQLLAAAMMPKETEDG